MMSVFCAVESVWTSWWHESAYQAETELVCSPRRSRQQTEPEERDEEDEGEGERVVEEPEAGAVGNLWWKAAPGEIVDMMSWSITSQLIGVMCLKVL